MNDTQMSEFKIKDGVLVKYQGKAAAVTVPQGITAIGNEAFSECKSLKSINLPEGLTTIGEKAFYWCSSLESISLPESLTAIGESAFAQCSTL
jgi:hypothetical protein